MAREEWVRELNVDFSEELEPEQWIVLLGFT